MKGILSITLLFFIVAISCKEANSDDPCNINSGHGGLGPANDRDIVFWIAKDMGCGRITIKSIVKKGIGPVGYSGPMQITKYFLTKPTCKSDGAAIANVIRGFTYEYTLACETGKEWKGEIETGCGDECVFVELK